MHRGVVRRWALIFPVCLACSSGGDDGGTATDGSGDGTTGTTAAGGTTGEDPSTSGSPTTTSGPDGSSTGAESGSETQGTDGDSASGSTSGTGGGTTGSASGTGGSGGGTAGSGGGGTGGGEPGMCPEDMGERPEHTMYACCSVSGGSIAGCLQVLNAICISDPVTRVGFCTAPGCSDPMLDCDPAPAGTASPTCIDDGVDVFCALDCSAGTCPDGMTCSRITVMGAFREICL